MRRLPLLLILLLPFGQTPVQAAEVQATSSISAVTVFPEGAEISRSAKVTMEPGEHVIVLRDLPAGLVADSIRVQGEATGNLVIGSVDSRIFYLSELADQTAAETERKRLEELLEGLVDQRTALESTIAAAEAQKQLIQNLTNLPTRPEPQSGPGALQAGYDWPGLFALIGQKMGEASKVVNDTRIALRALDRKIADVQNQLNQSPLANEQRTEIKIFVTAEAPLEATLRVRYQVPQAWWQPMYDARLSTGDKDEPPKLLVSRRARVGQQTGEDWKDVALTLSTTRPQAGTAAPDLYPIAVDFEPDAVPMAKMRRKGSAEEKDDAAMMDGLAAGGSYAEAPATVAAPEPAAPAPTAIVQRQAVVTDAAFQATFAIEGRQTIKTEVGEKRLLIDTLALEPLLTVRSVPKETSTAYLYAKFKLGEGALMLPGDASLFRDGIYVGHGALPLLNGGEEHELGFGVDDKIRVKFATMERLTGESGIISASKTETASFKITVKNLHERAMSVRIADQIPVSANEDIKVELSSSTTKPSLMNVDDKRGVLAWDLKLEADQETEIAFGYQVSWPSAKRVIYTPQPGPWPVPN